MLVVVSDTHGTDSHRLEGSTLKAVRSADLVVHAGDFTTNAVLDGFEDVTERLVAVHGNVDEPAVRERLPPTRTFEESGLRIALTHRRDGGDTGLALFGRERDADLVVSGHSHRPRFLDAGDVALLNPGSHAQPRGNRPAHAELFPGDGRESDAIPGEESAGDAIPEKGSAGATIRGRLRQPDGTVFEEFAIRSRR